MRNWCSGFNSRANNRHRNTIDENTGGLQPESMSAEMKVKSLNSDDKTVLDTLLINNLYDLKQAQLSAHFMD